VFDTPIIVVFTPVIIPFIVVVFDVGPVMYDELVINVVVTPEFWINEYHILFPEADVYVPSPI